MNTSCDRARLQAKRSIGRPRRMRRGSPSLPRPDWLRWPHFLGSAGRLQRPRRRSGRELPPTPDRPRSGKAGIPGQRHAGRKTRRSTDGPPGRVRQTTALRMCGAHGFREPRTTRTNQVSDHLLDDPCLVRTRFMLRRDGPHPLRKRFGLRQQPVSSVSTLRRRARQEIDGCGHHGGEDRTTG